MENKYVNHNHVKRFQISPDGTTAEIATREGLYYLIGPDGRKSLLSKKDVELIKKGEFERVIGKYKVRLEYNNR